MKILMASLHQANPLPVERPPFVSAQPFQPQNIAADLVRFEAKPDSGPALTEDQQQLLLQIRKEQQQHALFGRLFFPELERSWLSRFMRGEQSEANLQALVEKKLLHQRREASYYSAGPITKTEGFWVWDTKTSQQQYRRPDNIYYSLTGAGHRYAKQLLNQKNSG
ncbi:MAG: hypothetical protein SFZ03_07580 [Candidatus Melainabacteria bacterium]|nr:hypothetical protein [Candidatus Melainabacteria bacterium]